MASFPPNRATTLKAAFRACDVGPLVGADIERYYLEKGERGKEEVVLNVCTNFK